MTKRPLGRTGFQASILGIGDLADRTVPLETCVATLQRALDFGFASGRSKPATAGQIKTSYVEVKYPLRGGAGWASSRR